MPIHSARLFNSPSSSRSDAIHHEELQQRVAPAPDRRCAAAPPALSATRGSMRAETRPSAQASHACAQRLRWTQLVGRGGRPREERRVRGIAERPQHAGDVLERRLLLALRGCRPGDVALDVLDGDVALGEQYLAQPIVAVNPELHRAAVSSVASERIVVEQLAPRLEDALRQRGGVGRHPCAAPNRAPPQAGERPFGVCARSIGGRARDRRARAVPARSAGQWCQPRAPRASRRCGGREVPAMSR